MEFITKYPLATCILATLIGMAIIITLAWKLEEHIENDRKVCREECRQDYQFIQKNSIEKCSDESFSQCMKRCK
jgi:hypothetical protein